MKRTILNVQEETSCEWCGWPLDVGDRCEDSADGSVYCSRTCLETAAEYEHRAHLQEVG